MKDKTMNNILLDALQASCQTFSNKEKNKETSLSTFFLKNRINACFLKDTGFIIPSQTKPKKVFIVDMKHPEPFNYAFKKNAGFTIESNDSLSGGLSGTIDIALLLCAYVQNREEFKDAIITIVLGSGNKTSGLNNFLNSVHKDIVKDLTFIKLKTYPLKKKSFNKNIYVKSKKTKELLKREFKDITFCKEEKKEIKSLAIQKLSHLLFEFSLFGNSSKEFTSIKENNLNNLLFTIKKINRIL